jgi:hypothetical protein
VNSLSREQIIAIFSLAVAVVGTLAAALAVQKKLVRFLLIVLTSALALAFCVYINTSLYDEKSLKELSREEMIQEAKQQLKEEKTRQDEVFKQARERLDRERTEREAAENAAKETNKQDEVEREAREAIVREDAVKKLREQMESEKAEKARKVAEALIVGKWNGINWCAAKRIEISKDGKYYNRDLGLVYTYRVVDSTHLDLKGALINGTLEFKVSEDTLNFFCGTFTRAK